MEPIAYKYQNEIFKENPRSQYGECFPIYKFDESFAVCSTGDVYVIRDENLLPTHYLIPIEQYKALSGSEKDLIEFCHENIIDLRNIQTLGFTVNTEEMTANGKKFTFDWPKRNIYSITTENGYILQETNSEKMSPIIKRGITGIAWQNAVNELLAIQNALAFYSDVKIPLHMLREEYDV